MRWLAALDDFRNYLISAASTACLNLVIWSSGHRVVEIATTR